MKVFLDASSTLAISTSKINDKNIRKPFKKFVKRVDNKPRSNDQIRVPEVRLIDEKGENVGIVSTNEALLRAQNAGLDLVEISKDAKPPVAKIIDIGKYMYQKEKAEKEKKAKQKSSDLKTVKVGLMTSDHDAQVKIKKLLDFLSDGHKVKVEMFLKGRMRGNRPFAREKFKQFLEKIDFEYKIEQPMKDIPSGFTILLSK